MHYVHVVHVHVERTMHGRRLRLERLDVLVPTSWSRTKVPSSPLVLAGASTTEETPKTKKRRSSFILLSPSASSVLHRIITMLSNRLGAAARVSRTAGKTATRGRSSVARAASRRSAAVGGTSVARSRVPALFYTTERVVELRSGKSRAEQPPTMYSPERETENCGVGLVASLKSVPSRKIVEDADEMLVRMAHRGGCGCDPASGDGAGELTAALQKDAR